MHQLLLDSLIALVVVFLRLRSKLIRYDSVHLQEVLLSHGEQDEQEPAAGRDNAQGGSSRDVRRRDGQHPKVEQHEENSLGITDDDHSDDWPGDPQGLVERSISYQGPLPHSAELSGYEALSPGAATKLIDAHVYEKKAGADALTRLTRSEAFGVSFGAVVAGLLILGGLTAGVILVLAEKPLAATFFGALPVLGGSATGIISAVKGNGK